MSFTCNIDLYITAIIVSKGIYNLYIYNMFNINFSNTYLTTPTPPHSI